MSGSPFQQALTALRKPLEFAAKDDFARAARVRDLDRSLREGADRALALAIPRDARRLLERVRDRFPSGSDPGRRLALLRKTVDEIGPLLAPGWCEEALARPVTALPGVGVKRADSLARKGLRSVADLLFHLPAHYDDRRRLVSIGSLEVGRRSSFVGRVLVSDFIAFRSRRGFRRIFQAVVGDDSGTVNLKWFRGGESISRNVRKGALLLVTGDVKRYRFARELVHPEIDLLASSGESGESGKPGEPGVREGSDLENRRKIVPVYSAPEGLHPRALRRLVDAALAQYADLVEGHLPPSLVRSRGLPDAAEALRTLHSPGDDADAVALGLHSSPEQQRLILEELYLLEIGLALRRLRQEQAPGIALPMDGPRTQAAWRSLPFRLTGAQERVWAEIRRDLTRPHPMQRLLQGDVGSGKTAIAFLAALAVAESGHQSALMAPTELLAEQHAETLDSLARSGGKVTALRMGLLTASRSKAENEAVGSALGEGNLDLVIGTHALVQKSVQFQHLALAIVDEQHRFGVRARQALAEKGSRGALPHVLVMTATPIPRTLALTLYGDLDLSVLDELPPGRSPVATRLIRPGESGRVLEALKETLARGEQAFVVYPLVDESEKMDLRSATESAERIRAALPSDSVDLVHGRLDATTRQEAMARFARGETRVLVSTTVIEVGVDVPNATLMIVEHAERFGLAQLHQLRGRVGRGERPGRCFLVARRSTEESEARLRAMLATNDGFEIADADLRIRGPGEFLGTRQSGRLPELRMADLVRDGKLIAAAREAALEVVRRDPTLGKAPELAAAVERQWGARLALADVG